jgi:flagellar biosynthesis protein FlhB
MNSWWISGIILLAGFFIGLFLILRSKWKVNRKNINDYQQGRDKLTYRKKKEEVSVTSDIPDSFDLQSVIIGIFSTLMWISISLLMMSCIREEINSSAINSSTSLAAEEVFTSFSGLVDYLPLFMVLFILFIVFFVFKNFIAIGEGLL